MKKLLIQDSPIKKIVRSPDYNFDFDKKTGMFVRWGKTFEDDPLRAPAPEILDLEISYGPCSQHCEFCYKENGSGTLHNMTFDEFKIILDKMPKILTQIAFGITDIYTNPDFFKMMEYARASGVIPNYTTSGFDLDEQAVKKTKELCGAVAVSIHDKEKAFNAIKAFTDAGMTQVNVHWVLMEENYDDTFKMIDQLISDPRTSKLNAFVMLAYKDKGAGKGKFHSIHSVEKYRKLIDYCEEKKIGYGFDSCSAPVFFKSLQDTDRYEKISMLGEACESTLFSSYINADGKFFPCSFNEEEGIEGLDVLSCNDFSKDIWMHETTQKFRNKLLSTSSGCNGCPSQKFCRSCPTFDVTTCHKEYQ